MEGSFAIETIDLSKRYGSILAVDGLSLSVPRGGVFGLLGPNSSGKTTTMGMLLGLVRPTSGTFKLLAGLLGVPRWRIQILGGWTSRDRVIAVDGLDWEEVSKRLRRT